MTDGGAPLRAVLRTAPWTRSPLLVLREPMALLAVAAATAVLGLVAAGGPLFIASVGTGALHLAAAERCVQEDQLSVVNPALNTDLAVPAGPQSPATVLAADPVVRDAFGSVGLPAPLLARYATVDTGDDSGLRPAQVGLFDAEDSLAHVDLVEGTPAATGVHLPDTYAAQLGVHAGDQLALASGPVPIAGVYRDLDTAGYRTVLPDHWCHWRDRIVTSVSSRPPPFVLADTATLAALAPSVQAEWTSPVDVDGLTVADARAVVAAGRALFSAAELDPHANSPVAGADVRTQLDFDVTETIELQDAVGSPVAALATAGGALSLALVGGAALFWVQRRHSELRLLAARGVSPLALGLKAAGELGGPAALGCVLGWAAGLVVVPLLGPSTLLEPGAPVRGLAAAGTAWLACLATLVAVGTVVTGERRRAPSRPVRSTALAAAVLLPVVLGAALLRGADLEQLAQPGVYLIDPALLLAPILGLTGLVLAAALLAAAPLPRLREGAGRRGIPVFTAVNRAAAARTALVAVVCGLAVPTAVAVYGAGFTASSAETVQQKADTYSGAPVVLDVRVRFGELPDVGPGATPVSWIRAGAVDADGRALGDVEVLGVDPATFARYAIAHADVTGRPLPDLLTRLGDSGPGRAVPAILAAGGPSPATVEVRSSALDIDVVGTAPAFPGMRLPGRPALVVDLAALAGLDRYAGWHNELWTDQQHVGAVLAGLTGRGVLTDDIEDPSTFLDATSLLPVTWTFDFLTALSALLAGVSAAGLLLFLAARAQRQEIGYVLMRRMGMTRGAHRRSLLLEIGALTGWAWTAGCLTGTLALAVATRMVDVDPGFPPPTVLRLPLGTAALAAGLLGAAAALLSWWAARRSERADPGVVLRS